MKQIASIIIIGILALLNSCVVDSWENYDLVFKNQSNHKIEIKGYYYEELIMDIMMNPEEIADYQTKQEPGINTILKAKPLWVTFDDTIAIRHDITFLDDGSPRLKRSIKLLDSYICVGIGEHQQSCEYTFTNEDYEEALLLHQSEE